MNKTLYFVTGNTGEGFVNYLPSNVVNLEIIIVLKHPSRRLKTSVINHLIMQLEKENHLEIICSSLGNDFLDGVIIREKSVAVVDEAITTTLDLPLPIKEVRLNSYVTSVTNNEQIVSETEDLFQIYMENAYKQFKTGLNIHNQLESIFIQEMDFARANQMAEDFIENLLYHVPKKKNKSHIFHRLFGTNRTDGIINVVPKLLADMQRSYFIKGRAGTGKSTFMKKVLAACEEHGFDIELYHCSFDPNSIDMVLVRELSFCIFDSTDPHEFFPKRKGEEIIDMYEETVTPGTDEKYAKQIAEVTTAYKSHIKKGMHQLKEAGIYLKKKEDQFMFNETDVAKITNLLLNKYF